MHQQRINLKKIHELRQIAQKLKTIWYFFGIPIPVYWNGIQKGLAIENLLNQIPIPKNFDFEDSKNPIANAIKKTLSASRWVWTFHSEEGEGEGEGESPHPHM